MLNISTFHNYFEALATLHKKIDHDPVNEKKSFFRFDEEEFAAYLNTQARFPCIILAEPEGDANDKSNSHQP